MSCYCNCAWRMLSMGGGVEGPMLVHSCIIVLHVSHSILCNIIGPVSFNLSRDERERARHVTLRFESPPYTKKYSGFRGWLEVKYCEVDYSLKVHNFGIRYTHIQYVHLFTRHTCTKWIQSAVYKRNSLKKQLPEQNSSILLFYRGNKLQYLIFAK
jgi:hypothetical protein